MYIRVTVYPGAKKEKVTVLGEHRLELMVKEPAERNLANERVRALVAREYRVSVAAVRMISGHHGQRKILSITNVD